MADTGLLLVESVPGIWVTLSCCSGLGQDGYCWDGTSDHGERCCWMATVEAAVQESLKVQICVFGVT